MTRKSFSPRAPDNDCVALAHVSMSQIASCPNAATSAPAHGRQSCIPCRIPDTTLRALDHIPNRSPPSYPPCPISHRSLPTDSSLPGAARNADAVRYAVLSSPHFPLDLSSVSLYLAGRIVFWVPPCKRAERVGLIE